MGGAADVGAGVTAARTVRRQRTNHQRPDPAALRCRVTLPDGRPVSGELPAERHRALQLWMLHRQTAGLVELTPGTRDLEGRLHVDRRSRPEHYLPGGAGGDKQWLAKLLEHAWEICDGKYARMRFDDGPREEVFVGVSERSEPRGAKDAVTQARWLWIDVDRPDRLDVLWEFLGERPCHLLVESAGSGGVHAYWQLAEALPAREGDGEPIERANLRIIQALGEDVADANCFPAGTLVLTENGYQPIEALGPGLRVLTHLGRWKRVSAVSDRRADTVRVTGHGHPGLEVTADHPFLSRTRMSRWSHGPLVNGCPEWVGAKDLTGRCWATRTSIDAVEIPLVGGRGFDFSSTFWWLVGRWLGDGWVVDRGPHSSRKGERSAVVGLCCGHKEREVLTERLNAFAPVGPRGCTGRGELRWSVQTRRTATVFLTGHEGLAEWLKDHFGCGSLWKHLPAFVFGMPREWRAALLDGYVSADGAIIVDRRAAQTSSISKPLSLGVRQLAETLGYRAGLYCYPQPTDVIEGRKVRTHDQWHVRWKIEPRRFDAIEEGGLAWLRVKNVQPARKNVEVFNLSVEDDESYVVEGLVVHNCKERSRVLRLAGTVNFKSGRHARIIEANLALPPYELEQLVGDLPDPPNAHAPSPDVQRGGGEGEDPYKRIPATTYFALLAGITVPPRGGLVRCPAHDDEHPSCSVAPEPGTLWRCHACGAGGTLFDLASALLGGPTGHQLRGEAFKRARAYVGEVLGEEVKS